MSSERFLNVNPGTGLADVLMGRATLAEATRESGIRNLWIVGAGTPLAWVPVDGRNALTGV